MNTVDLTPYWPATDDWAGFLLVLLPAGPLPVAPEELRRSVRRQIETDAVLYDLVTVALAPTYRPTAQWERDLLTGLIEAAMPERHFFAPRGVIGVAVLSDRSDDLKSALAGVKKVTALPELGAKLFSAGVPRDPREAASADSAQRIAGIATMLIEDYEASPQSAVPEREFLHRVGRLITEEDLALPGLLPRQWVAEEPVYRSEAARIAERPQPRHATPQPPSTSERLTGSQPQALAQQAVQPQLPSQTVQLPSQTVQLPSQTVQLPSQTAQLPSPPSPPSLPPEAAPPLSSAPQPDLLPRSDSGSRSDSGPPMVSAPPSRPPLVAPVVYDGAEIVVVDQRTPRERLLGQHRTEAQTMDRLVRARRAVALVYLVFVPDDGVVSKAAARSRTAIALELDRLLATVDVDALTGERAHVAVEVLSATNPVRKHGILREAGELTESMLPEVPIEYFDFLEVVEPLIDAASRNVRAIEARGIEVVSLHFVFFASIGFPADEVTEDEWMRLLEVARVTWIDFSPVQRRSAHRMPASPYGLHVLTDKEDVVAVIRKQSEVLYRYASTPQPLPLPPVAAPVRKDAESQGRAGRWWRFGREKS